MPAIHLFHRRTIMGGDDLQPAAFLTVCLRGVQLTVLLGPVIFHIVTESSHVGGIYKYMMYDPSNDQNCRHSNLYATLLVCYAAASGLYCIFSLLLEWRITYWSSIGSPTETEPRNSKVRGLLELKLIPFSVLLFLIWMMGISALLFLPLYNYCYDLSQDTMYANDVVQEEEQFQPSFWRSIHIWWITIALLLMGQIAELLVYWVFLWHLCRRPLGANLADNPDHMELTLTHELIEEMWADRCAAACQCLSVSSCFMFGGRELLGQAEFGDVARALADYLETRGTLDVVPSDIVTGFVLLQKLQRQKIRRARMEVVRQNSSGLSSMERGESRHNQFVVNSGTEAFVPLGSSPLSTEPISTNPQRSMYALGSDGEYEQVSRNVLDRANYDDLLVLEEGARYARYALAIYTWVLYLYVNPCSGARRLCADSANVYCCSSQNRRRRTELVMEGDNMCNTNKTALLLAAGLNDSDLVYAQFRNGFRDTPYAILIDHAWSSIVITIRGTFSLEDCVTDVLIDPEPLESLGEEFGFNAENQFCHGGVLTCVRNVYRDLQQHGLLENLLFGDHAQYPGYHLRIVGHSLGASTGTLLSYMLRQKYPTLRCINYSPPGHSLTWEMATGCHQWCTTFVLDSDLVPRLSFAAMERLRDDVLQLIGRVKVPKIEVASRLVQGSGLSRCNWFENDECDEGIVQDVNRLLHDPRNVPDSEFQRQLEHFQQIQGERRESRGQVRGLQFFPPGKMVHLVKVGEQHTCFRNLTKCATLGASNAGSSYLPVWIHNDDLTEIIVAPTMGTDHFPDRIDGTLQAVANEYGIFV